MRHVLVPERSAGLGLHDLDAVCASPTADRLLAEGKDVASVCRELGVSEQTYHRWRNQFGGLKADDAKRLKDLER